MRESSNRVTQQSCKARKQEWAICTNVMPIWAKQDMARKDSHQDGHMLQCQGVWLAGDDMKPLPGCPVWTPSREHCVTLLFQSLTFQHLGLHHLCSQAKCWYAQTAPRLKHDWVGEWEIRAKLTLASFIDHGIDCAIYCLWGAIQHSISSINALDCSMGMGIQLHVYMS